MISVLLPTFNRAERIQNAIQSILDQTFKDFELVIIDDGSTDGTKRVVESFENPRIEYHKIEHQGNLSRVRNIAIQKAQGELCVVQDSDDMSFPNRLEEIWNYYQEYKIDIIYHDFYLRSYDVTRNAVVRRIRKIGPYNRDALIKTQYLPGQIAFTRKIGIKYPYNEKIKVMDDLVFLMELALNNATFGYIEKYLYDYVISQDSINIQASYDNRKVEDAKEIIKILKGYGIDAKAELSTRDMDTGELSNKYYV